MPTGNKTMAQFNRSDFAQSIEFEDGQLKLILADGRAFLLPLLLYPSLATADADTRANYEIIGTGIGFHWPDLDLDLSTDQLVHGDAEVTPRPPDLSRKPIKRRPDENHRVRMKAWVLDALEDLGGAGAIVDVARIVWRRHEREISSADDLLYKWQHELRWAADLLRKDGKIVSTQGFWRLAKSSEFRRGA